MALFRFTDAVLRGDAIDLHDQGRPRRDYTYIDDVVDGISSVLERPPCGDPDWDGRQSSISPAPARVYNLGNGRPASVTELLAAVEAELGMKARIRMAPMQPGDVATTWADCTALRGRTGFRPRLDIREGVRRFVQWHREYHDGAASSASKP